MVNIVLPGKPSIPGGPGIPMIKNVYINEQFMMFFYNFWLKTFWYYNIVI